MTSPTVADRLTALRSRIDAIERSWSHPVRVVAVTKGFGPEVLQAALDANCDAVGENYAQELLSKRSVIDDCPPGRRPEVHFIGRLQSNKVRQLVGLIDVWSTLDRSSLIKAISRRAPGARVLVQVNTTGEEGKGGCPPDRVQALVLAAREAGLTVDGIMTVGPTGRPPDDARAGFRVARSLVDELGLEVCSMGMSADLPIAVEEGATEVRVGTALFGPRPTSR